MPVTGVEKTLSEEETLVSKTDLKGRITFLNQAFIDISGYSREELMGAPHNLVRHPDMPPEAFADLWNTINGGKSWTALVKNRCKSGDFYWVEANVTPLREGEQITGFISVRNKPSREQVAAAEPIYRDIREGRSNLTIKEGKVVSRGMLARLGTLKNPSIKARLGLAVALPCVLLAGIGIAGLGGAAVEYRAAYIAALVLSAMVSAAFGAYFIGSVMRPLREVSLVVACAASGDFSRNIRVVSDDETGQLLKLLATMNRNMRRVLRNVRRGATVVESASREIAQSNADLSSRTEEQASSLEETASSMEELTSTVKQNTENARQANQLAAGASEVAVKGGQVVSQVVQTMSSINDSSKKIADIINVIDGIAFQTNILALNAAVEAARAGEQGRGFAVVATEVRTLAQRSAAAAKEIKELISDSVGKVEDGTKLVDQAGKTMGEIVAAVKRVTDVMAEIAAASQEQSSGIEQVNQAVTQMDEATQQNAALVEEASAAAESMEEQAQNLTQAMAVFKLAHKEEQAVAKAEKHVASVTHLPAKRAAVKGRVAAEKKPAASQVRKAVNAKPGDEE